MSGWTRESVQRCHTMHSFPKGAVESLIANIDDEHSEALHAENARGGEARQVVADVARILGTDIDAGSGHRWDADHMQRVVRSAEWLKAEAARSQAAYHATWELHQQRGTQIFELQGEKADLREAYEKARADAERYKAAYELKPATMRLDGPGAEALAARIDDIDELRATIVSQAREIARLKGESA